MDAHAAMIRTLTFLAILVAAASAVIGFVLTGGWVLLAVALAAGALWLVDIRRGRHRFASPLLVVFVLLAAVSAGLSGGRVLAPLVVVAALAAWDLDRFAARMAEAVAGNGEQQAERRKLETQHLRRLLVVSALGLALAWLAEFVRVPLSFGWAVALGLLAALGLAGLVRALVRESDE
jgi:hypothetical protein